MKLNKYCITIGYIFILTGCGGPLSLGVTAVGLGVGMYSQDQLRDEAFRAKYINKCVPTHEIMDAYTAGVEEEYAALASSKQGKNLDVTEHMITALEYYYIANKLGDSRAQPRIMYLEKYMPDNEKNKAKMRFSRYTDINLNTCYAKF